jgi:hypothetical protein
MKLNDNRQGIGTQIPQAYRDARRALRGKIPGGSSKQINNNLELNGYNRDFLYGNKTFR